MRIKSTRERLLTSTIILGAAALSIAGASQAMAQATPTNQPGSGAQAPVAGAPPESLPGSGVNAADANNGTTANTVQEVTVTGSRIAAPNLRSVSPVTVVNNQEIKLEGTTRVEDLINNLPQAFGDQRGSISNGSSGTATVNLRNLGASRTLVLIDGKRLLPGDPSSPFADLNFIPAQLVDRVDVVTGGASAVYGSDAVAGVVNFIMQKNFSGVRLDAQYSTYQHDNASSVQSIVRARALTAGNPASFALPEDSVRDGETVDINAIIGVNSPDGKGNATVYAGYRNIKPVLQANRDYSSCSLSSSQVAFTCGGSGTTSPARFLTNGGAALYVANPAPFPLVPDTFSLCPLTKPAAGYPTGCSDATAGLIRIPSQDLTLNPAAPGGNAFRNYVGARDQYNFGPINYYQRPDERYTFGSFAHYEVNKSLDVYSQFMFMDDHTQAQIAASGIFLQTQNVNCDNPFLSAAQVTNFCTTYGLSATPVAQADGSVKADSAPIVIGKRNVEGGGRVADLRHTDYRIVLGAKGELGSAWNYDISGQYSTVVFAQNYLNDFSISRTAKALQARRDASGNIVCQSVIDGTDPNCVPYNIFATNGVTQGALNYLQTPGFQAGSTTEQVVSANVTGQLGEYGLKSPFADDGVGVAFGTEYRREALELRTDAAFQTGDLAGQGGATLPIKGAFDVYELYTEVRVPLVQNKPFIESLSFEGGYRFSDYSTAGITNTYKFAADYSPTRDIRFRGSYNKAVRAPNVIELFATQNVQLDGSSDPCAGTAPAATAAQCALTGVSAAQYGSILENPASQYNGLTGGNPNLAPEESETKSFGAVITPRFLPNFSLAIDYFDINVTGTIGGIGADTIIQGCVDTANPFLCSLIKRAPGNGSLFLGTAGYIIDTTLNTGSLGTKGVDIEGNYRLPLSTFGLDRFGSLAFNYVGTYTDSYRVQPLPGGDSYDCKGLFGIVCGTPIPEYRHRLRVSWQTPWNMQFSGSWRYISGVTEDAANPDIGGTVFKTEAKLPSFSYLDLAATWRIKDQYTFRVGVNNVLDVDPPLVGSSSLTGVFGNGNTFPQVYDALGRYLFVGLTADF